MTSASGTKEKASAGDPIPPKCSVIEVHVGELKQLFNAIDPSPFRLFSRYGLRYGFASATGNFQRLRGRPPLVSPLKSFTAVTRVQIPSGTPNLFRSLRGTATFGAGTKRHNSVANFLPGLPNRECFRASGAVLVGTKRHMQFSQIRRPQPRVRETGE